MTTAGRISLVVFDGIGGGRFFIKTTNGTVQSSALDVYAPNGTKLAADIIGTGTDFLDTTTIVGTGTLTIKMDPAGTYTGGFDMTVYDVPPDLAGTIVPGGASVGVTLGTPGQNGRFTFNGSVSQRVSLKISSNTISSSGVHLKNPDNTTLASKYSSSSPDFLDTQTLIAAGTHAIVVDPLKWYTGSMTLTLYDVPPDVTGTISAGGASVGITLGTPGQNARLTFSGTKDQRISLLITNNTISSASVQIKNPDNTTLGSVYPSTSTAFIDVKTLPQTGTHAIVVDPLNWYTGSETLTLYDVPPDVSGTVTIGGPAVGVTIGTPGQNGRLTFEGTSGQEVTVRITNNTMSTVAVRLLKPDGGQLTSNISSLSSFNLSTQTLPATGTYTITIDPSSANTGSMNVSVTNP